MANDARTELQEIANLLMELYTDINDTAAPEVYGSILGMHERIELFLESEPGEELLQQSLESLTWMIADIKYRHDVDMAGDDMIGVGGYSPELTKATDLQKELEEYLRQGSEDNERIQKKKE